jgi:hypothetical protein
MTNIPTCPLDSSSLNPISCSGALYVFTPLARVSLAFSFNVRWPMMLRKTSILWDVVGAHLSLQLSPNGSEAADDPRVDVVRSTGSLGLFSFAQTFIAQFCEAWVVEVWKIYRTIGYGLSLWISL